MFAGWQKTIQKTPVRTRSKRGLLDEDGWKCDCSPRLPAMKRITKKESVNKGREFYNCVNMDTGCGFFLWADDARVRENHESPLKSNYQLLTPGITPRRSPRDNPITPNTQNSPTKRRISNIEPVKFPPTAEARDDNEDSEIDDIAFSNRSVNRTLDFTTPRKERRITTQTSPSKTRMAPPRLRELESLTPIAKPATSTATTSTIMSPQVRGIRRYFPTPTKKDNDDNIFTTPPVHPTKKNIFATPMSQPTIKNSARPSTPPLQLGYSPTVPITPRSSTIYSDSPGRGPQDSLITDVFVLLTKNGVNLKGTAGDLRSLLERHARQKEGVKQGREVARQALARKTEECCTLKEQVRELEEEKKRAKKATEMLEKGMAELAEELQRVKLSQSQSQSQSYGKRCESGLEDVESLDTSYLYIN